MTKEPDKYDPYYDCWGGEMDFKKEFHKEPWFVGVRLGCEDNCFCGNTEIYVSASSSKARKQIRNLFKKGWRHYTVKVVMSGFDAEVARSKRWHKWKDSQKH